MNFRKGDAEHIQLLKLDKETGQALGGLNIIITYSKGNKDMIVVSKDVASDNSGKLMDGENGRILKIDRVVEF